jgi:hypothetical protein
MLSPTYTAMDFPCRGPVRVEAAGAPAAKAAPALAPRTSVRCTLGCGCADACRLATALFGEPRQQGSSHRVWRMWWAGDPRVNMQKSKGGRAKAYQVQQLLTAVDRYRTERARTAGAGKPPSKGVAPKAKKGERRSQGLGSHREPNTWASSRSWTSAAIGSAGRRRTSRPTASSVPTRPAAELKRSAPSGESRFGQTKRVLSSSRSASDVVKSGADFDRRRSQCE